VEISSGRPFEQTQIDDDVFARVFARDVDHDELVWHRDEKTRKVTVIESSGWFIQYDNELPVEMNKGDEYTIDAGVYHRILRSRECSDLVVIIKE
jgi:hypothetical protein